MNHGNIRSADRRAHGVVGRKEGATVDLTGGIRVVPPPVDSSREERAQLCRSRQLDWGEEEMNERTTLGLTLRHPQSRPRGNATLGFAHEVW